MSKRLMQEERKALEERLKEIQSTSLESLSDEAVLELLAERKHVENALLEYVKADNMHESLVHEEEEVEARIASLNQEIGPDKKDEELLALVQERHQLEEELLKIHKELEEPLPIVETEVSKPVKTESSQKEKKEELEVVAPQEQEESQESEESTERAAEEKIEIAPVSEKKSLFKEDTFGNEEIHFDKLQESGDFEKYVHQLESSRESLGSFMQTLPREARGNKLFMLRVATVDPAYAMHYAVDALRKDEDFHIKIASMPNNRNSGNAIAEMDRDMHTGKVILAATRQDFRNVHYIREDMPEYDEIVAVAKKGALERVGQLKEAVSLEAIIPKSLRSDEAFMKDIEKALAKKTE